MNNNLITQKCNITAVFPKLESQQEYKGIVQIQDDDLVVYIEYDLDDNSFAFREQIQCFDNNSNNFYLKITTTVPNHTDYYTCFNCYCKTPFITTSTSEGILKTPYGNSGVLEIHCNSWIEGIICEDVYEKSWKEVQLDFKYLENWGDLQNNTFTFQINSHLSLLIDIFVTETHSSFPPQEIKRKDIKFFISSDQCESIDYFSTITYQFFLLIRFLTDINIPSGTYTYFQETNHSNIENTGCRLHYRSSIKVNTYDRPSAIEYINMPFPLSKLINHPTCVSNWFKCCETNLNSITRFTISCTDEYFLDQRIISLIQSFDGLNNFIFPETIVDVESFNEWISFVMQKAHEAACTLGIEDLNVMNRLNGTLSNFNHNPLRSRLANFIKTHFENNPDIEKIGGEKKILEIMMKLRHGSAHGNYIISSCLEIENLYTLWRIMKSVDRLLITNYILKN